MYLLILPSQDYSDDESDSEEEAVAERGGKRVKSK